MIAFSHYTFPPYEHAFHGNLSRRPWRPSRNHPRERQKRRSREVDSRFNRGKGLDIVLIHGPLAVELGKHIYAVCRTSYHPAHNPFGREGIRAFDDRALEHGRRAIL